MKLLVCLLVFSVSASAFARLSDSQQLAVVEKVAKGHRRQMHIERYEDVESFVEKVSKARLDELVKFSPGAEHPLNKEEISALYRCQHSSKSCSLYLISLTGSMYGGSGETHNYVMLDPNTGKYTEIMHLVYAE